MIHWHSHGDPQKQNQYLTIRSVLGENENEIAYSRNLCKENSSTIHAQWIHLRSINAALNLLSISQIVLT